MTRDDILAMFGGRCANEGCSNPASEIHHCLIHNTKRNRGRFPLLTDSSFNKIPLCKTCHYMHPHKWNISDMQASVFEKYLRELKGLK